MSPKSLTKEELVKLNSLFSTRMRGAAEQQQLNDFWQLLSEKYHFHSGHTIIHNITGEIVDNCYDDSNQESGAGQHAVWRRDHPDEGGG